MELRRLSTSPLTACPSPPGEKPEEPRDQVPSAASQTDPDHGGTSAEEGIDRQGSSTSRQGDSDPTPSVPDLRPGNDPAEAGVAAADSADDASGMEHFQRLRRRLLVSTLLASTAAVPLCWLLFDLPAALSLLVGAVAGLLYLVLLARSVARLGGERRSISKVQLLVPVVLVLASSRIPQLELVPALVGFLLYKPALLVQAFLDR